MNYKKLLIYIILIFGLTIPIAYLDHLTIHQFGWKQYYIFSAGEVFLFILGYECGKKFGKGELNIR